MSTNKTSILVLGGGGRMGREILAAAAADENVHVIGALDLGKGTTPLPGDPPQFTELDRALNAASGAVALEFTTARAVPEHIHAAAEAGVPIVVGTTGAGQPGKRAATEAAERIAVVVAPNTSPGVTLLRHAIRTILEGKGPRWDIAVLDRHHRRKRDAPSGTAYLLEGEIAGASGKPEIASFRQGGVTGEHTAYLTGEDEELVLVHRALSRRVFARGALLAATFAAGAKAGLYTMDDVLGGREV
jgi:4-hydroxy-tetrahydrodipicolinate reductase